MRLLAHGRRMIVCLKVRMDGIGGRRRLHCRCGRNACEKGRAACEAAATAAAIATLRFASEKLLENKGDPGPGRTVKGDPQDAGCVKPMRSPCWAFAQL